MSWLNSSSSSHWIRQTSHLSSPYLPRQPPQHLSLSSHSLSSAIPLSFMFYFHKLDDDDDVIGSRTFGKLKLKQPLKLPGCLPLQANDLSHLVVEHCFRFVEKFVLLMVYFLELEPDTISALQLTLRFTRSVQLSKPSRLITIICVSSGVRLVWERRDVVARATWWAGIWVRDEWSQVKFMDF